MDQMRGQSKWRRFQALGALVALSMILGIGTAWAQNPNQIDARPLINVEDKDDVTKPDGKVWVLNFNFYPPRQITVDIPGRGRRLCWYVRYEVVNRTKEPRVFLPDFELVTTDGPKPSVYHDQILPRAQEAIKQVEDPLGHMDIQNSVTIMSKPIPVSRPGGPPRPVTGVAIWDDVDPNARRFSIFVSGLSNGWSLAEIPPDNKQIVRRKTLQLNFKRLSDKQFSTDVIFAPPVEWVYRATGVTLPAAAKPSGDAPKKTTPSEK